MAWEQKDGSGSLFKNKKKESETHADYQGSIMVGGVEYWLNAWIKKGETTWMSLAAKPKDKQAARKPDNQPTRQREPGEDDSEPF